MSTATTIELTADWLCKKQPVVFTGRTSDQPLLADPFPIYQQCVKDNPAFFKDVHGYTPDPTSKTGLAGVRSRVWTNTFRDHVLLPALRVYRARTEGASLETVPEVTYSMKPSCDGRINKTIAQRGIMGFEPRAARKEGYIYNPERNPNLLDMPLAELPVALCTNWDKRADQHNGELEIDYYMALEALIALPVPSAPSASKRKAARIYMCSQCKVPKKGHVCPKAAPPGKRKGCSARPAVKRARK
jgi:hypothetical protein